MGKRFVSVLLTVFVIGFVILPKELATAAATEKSNKDANVRDCEWHNGEYTCNYEYDLSDNDAKDIAYVYQIFL